MASLQQQGEQTDSMKSQDKKDGEFDSSTAFVFLIERGSLGNERALRTLIIHLIFDLLVEACSWLRFVSPRGFPSKNPEANFSNSETVFFHSDQAAFLSSILGYVCHTPLLIDLTVRQKISPSSW